MLNRASREEEEEGEKKGVLLTCLKGEGRGAKNGMMVSDIHPWRKKRESSWLICRLYLAWYESKQKKWAKKHFLCHH